MEHWENVLPGFMYSLRYEDMVADQDNQTRRLLDFCGLPWDDACLAFHKTKRVVKTASYVQVRQPIYKDSVQLWKRYETQLEPLRKALDNESGFQTETKDSIGSTYLKYWYFCLPSHM